jgi:hypothetical protein
MHSDLHRLVQRALHEERLRDAAERRAAAIARAAPARRRVVVALHALRLLAARSADVRRRPARRARG